MYTAPDATNKLQIFRKLREMLTVGYKIILGGDFNTVTEDIDKCTTERRKTVERNLQRCRPNRCLSLTESL